MVNLKRLKKGGRGMVKMTGGANSRVGRLNDSTRQIGM